MAFLIYIIMELKKATRKQVKLRLGISAISGGGKTYSALLLAKGLVNDWEKICVIDTENESASLYSHLGDYNTIVLTAPYTPERYIQAIKACEDAGMECIVVDSITHEWDGKGGILDIHSQMTGNSFTNWSSLTPRHQKFIDAILHSKCHVVTTVRRKTEYEMTKENGKTKVEKSGLKEITRDGFEYELTVNFNLDEKHNCTTSKDRTGLFMDKPFFTITEETGKTIIDWCNSGTKVIPEIFKTAEEKQATAYTTNTGTFVSVGTIESTKAQLKEATDLTELVVVWNSLTVYQKNLPGIAEYKESQKLELTPKN